MQTYLIVSSFLHNREPYLNNILCALFSNPNRFSPGSNPKVRDQLCMHQQPNLILYEADAADNRKLRCPQVVCLSIWGEDLARFDHGIVICFRTALTLMNRHKTSLLAAVKMKMMLLWLSASTWTECTPSFWKKKIQDQINQINGAATSTHRWITC